MLAPLGILLASASVISAVCPYMGTQEPGTPQGALDQTNPDAQFSQFYANDQDSFMTTDSGTPMSDQVSLKAGLRGPTLLEDFIFRQKITRFDHERVPERAVHARGVGAHGVFTSYANWSNITAASFLGAEGKQTPVFLRFSTVAGSRGSSDLARDVHGFATRFYTEEGIFDIVGNNIPVFFIQDAIQFPDLVHAVKPKPQSEIPQAATNHDSAWDFFSQQPSSLHTLLWAMSGHGIPRSLRHVDGWGVHTFRLVTEQGNSTFVKFRFKCLQGRSSMLWEEAQTVSGKNPDFHRQDLWEAIESGRYPEWEFGVQLISEEEAKGLDFDLLDPTKIVPEDKYPFTALGKLVLNRNPVNYFAETEQAMFQPGHIVRGIDFTEDPLLQGRLFSYLDTQLNRHNGPNFEQLPINRPRNLVHNNNRDGAAQMMIHENPIHYTPSALGGTGPKQANQTVGRGFFTTPGRMAYGPLVRQRSPTFDDFWTQPRLFYNSLSKEEQQLVVDALRFENTGVQSEVVRKNVIMQLNRIDHNLAARVARTIGVPVPDPDPTYYHDRTTVPMGTLGDKLLKLDGLKVGLLTMGQNAASANALAATFKKMEPGLDIVIVGPALDSQNGVNTTYAATDAALLDGVIVVDGLLTAPSTAYPSGRPERIMVDAYRYWKPVAAVGSGSQQVISQVLAMVPGAPQTVQQPGVFFSDAMDETFVSQFLEGLRQNRFLNRILMDDDA
ncbi:hypothetical protein ACJ72_06247 [Emergomyces africanus]|uniref:Catalase n=1 Tax=Emergomyces africanus TaxID=1955775 RepID=A0A1B7NRS8_9EURO|nr:hypothetical protein ACJ72_06247 [Emergomyces africanus]